MAIGQVATVLPTKAHVEKICWATSTLLPAQLEFFLGAKMGRIPLVRPSRVAGLLGPLVQNAGHNV